MGAVASLFDRGGSRVTERLRNLPKVTQLVTGGSGFEPRSVGLESLNHWVLLLMKEIKQDRVIKKDRVSSDGCY